MQEICRFNGKKNAYVMKKKECVEFTFKNKKNMK